MLLHASHISSSLCTAHKEWKLLTSFITNEEVRGEISESASVTWDWLSDCLENVVHLDLQQDADSSEVGVEDQQHFYSRFLPDVWALHALTKGWPACEETHFDHLKLWFHSSGFQSTWGLEWRSVFHILTNFKGAPIDHNRLIMVLTGLIGGL